ncbi:alanine racemase [Actinobacteria bacterium IMCC25003]|nr:alanine racemase [Actinobacteria bacterium IMCC25003]
MRAEAIVDLSAIKHNVELLKKTAGTKLLAVVKADAYGHGLVPVAKAAISAGADYLGVALLEEAIALREAGIETPILAWLVQPGSDFAKAIELDIELAAASLAALKEISDASTSKKARVHLEVDTGMTRGGFLAEWDQLAAEHLKNIEIVGIFSHFARADEPGEKQNQEQLARFNEMVSRLHSLGFTNVIRHLSNSAATLKDHSAAFDMVRTGIAMYGLSPDVKTLGTSQSLGLRPAMQLRAALYLVKDVPANTPVGYGATENTSADTKLGVVAMGYADGIPRIAHDAGTWFSGKRAPIIGRVSMDQFVVDLGAASKAKSGDWVVIFGNGSHSEYTADDWGGASGSINYEIVTRIGPRVPRIYSAHVY